MADLDLVPIFPSSHKRYMHIRQVNHLHNHGIDYFCCDTDSVQCLSFSGSMQQWYRTRKLTEIRLMGSMLATLVRTKALLTKVMGQDQKRKALGYSHQT